MAKSEPGVPIDHTLLDVDPFLLNCPNGTVDLRTGELRPHNHMDMITRMTPVHYDPDAESYEWDKFLEKILVEQPLIDHVQRLMGYCITGSVREQVLPIFWGKGSNGKSTLLNLIKAAVGMDYASEAPDSLLAKKKNESHPTEVATLLGQRLVTTIETEEGQRLNEPLVKKLTGGDTIKTRRMRENPWEFKPTHKIILCTNHEPRVGNDDAIWRRLIMVPFVVKFWNPAKGETGPPELERDNELEDRLKACLPGILAWCVRGAVEWYKNGLSNPEIVQAATTKYQERQDTFGKFVEERCCTGEQYRVRFSDLYSHFEGWAKEIGERMLSRRAVGSWLESHGYQGVSSNGRWYIGITGKPEYDKTNTFEDTEWNDGTK
jgi:putative DNA primase/helicase